MWREGNLGDYVSDSGWLSGSEMGWGIVGNAQRNAVIAPFAWVNPTKSYYLTPTQHIASVDGWQTQGYMTLAATSVYTAIR